MSAFILGSKENSRMKKIGIICCIAVLAAGTVFAQEFTVSGELKTGFYMEQETIGDKTTASGGMKNTDGDSGFGEARIRMDFSLTYENIGLRTRFQVEPVGEIMPQPGWSFAYAYANMFDEQLKISAGLLGESPWITKGPRMTVELETVDYGYNYGVHQGFSSLAGIRFEYKPAFIPGLNVGLVLNQADQKVIDVKDQTFGDFLKESIVGIAYDHRYFTIRAAYRFDSELDTYTLNRKNEGARLVYYAEERVLGSLLEGMKLWLSGYFYGIGGDEDQPQYSLNWLYWLYDNKNFVAEFDVNFSSYKMHKNREYQPTGRKDYQELQLLPAFYVKLAGNMLQAGLRFGLGMEFGDGKTWADAPYKYYSIEPQVRFNMNSNNHLALVYNFTDSYVYPTVNNNAVFGDKSLKHHINLRAVFSF